MKKPLLTTCVPYLTSALISVSTAMAPNVFAADTANLAKQLANPIASLISVPFQLNYDNNIGPNDGDRFTLNIQPVIPFSISEDWNLISRTILPVISQDDVFYDSGRQTGLGDTVQSLFLSPAEVGQNGLVWGAGPVFLLPTATDELLGTEKWGVGPTAVILKQQGPWTYGGLANHIWSVAGDDDRGYVTSTFMQPFLCYTTPTATTYSLNTETTYNWESEEWSVPINFVVTQVLKLGNQLVSVGAGIRYWAESPESGPEGFGGRLVFTMMFPE